MPMKRWGKGKMNSMPWRVYIIKCSDAKLYTGITNDLARRIKAHNSGKGCRFTRYRVPVKLMYNEEAPNKSRALRREAQIKRWPKDKKLALIKGEKKYLLINPDKVVQ